MDLSVIVVSYNTRDYLQRCLASVYRNLQDLDVEVIVVDNDSRDGSVSMVQQFFPQAQLIVNDNNLGFSRANNQGLRVAKGDYVLLLNSDTEVKGCALQKMVTFLADHPDVAAVGCRLLNGDGTLQLSARMFNTFATEFFEHTYLDRFFRHSKVFGRHYLGGWDYQTNRDVDWVTGACLMVRREVLETVGLLDERFFMYAEDADWCYRIRQHGWRICFVSDAEVVHYGGESSKPVQKEMEMEKYRSKYRLLWKHRRYGLLAFSILMIGISLLLQTFAGFCLRLLRRNLSAKVSNRLEIAAYCLKQHFALMGQKARASSACPTEVTTTQ